MCGLSALALKTNSPSVLKNEALEYGLDTSSSSKMGYARCFGANDLVPAEKAILANSAAVREWDSNGTVFGFNDKYPGH
jgi:2-methylcitrate dehydratase